MCRSILSPEEESHEDDDVPLFHPQYDRDQDEVTGVASE